MSPITIYGVCAVSFMMVMYALEPRGRVFVLAFAPGCLLSSAYGFLSGAWPFGVVEADLGGRGAAALRGRARRARLSGAYSKHSGASSTARAMIRRVFSRVGWTAS